MPEDVSWSHFFSDSKKRFSEFTYSIFAGHYFICHLWPTNWNFSLHFCQSYPESRCVICTGVTLFCTGVKLFALVLYLNFTAVSQSELSNFLVYYYQSVRCIYTSLSIYFHPLLILTNVFFPNHFSGNSQFFDDCYYHSLRFSDSIEVGIAF